MSADATDQKRVLGWLEDVGFKATDGGVDGPTLDWALSMSFGSTTHVSVAHDTSHPRRLEVISDLSISEPHRAPYTRLSKAERAVVDRDILRVLLRRAKLSFHISRDDKGAPEKIALRGYLPIEGLTPGPLVEAIQDARNCTMELCVVFQEAFGVGVGPALERPHVEPGYTNVVLHQGTLETLDAFQIPGETLDETILRAVRE